MSKANNPTGGRRPNYGYAIISVSMVLFLLGFFGLVLLQAAQLSRSLKEGITPYRAQIARIRQELRSSGLDPDHYTVDTVERYQGGARRIVLISLCTNRGVQMSTLSTLSREGVDRKLNVAMTRAREHLVLLGNPRVLRESAVYSRLLDYCRAEAGYFSPVASV